MRQKKTDSKKRNIDINQYSTNSWCL